MYKKYKQYFIKFIIITLSIFISTILISDFIIRNYQLKKTYGESLNTHVWVKRKQEIAQEKSKYGKKLIFLSGSNTLFGINTQDIEKQIHIPTANLGLHVGYQYVIFEEFQDFINDEDIVIMPLEFNFFNKNTQKNYINESIAEYVICYGKNIYKKMSLSEKFECIKHLLLVHPFIANISSTPPENNNNTGIPETNPYSTNCWNNNGDIKCERTYQQSTFNNATAGEITLEDLKEITNNKSYLNRFLKNLKNKQAQIYFMPPVLVEGEQANTSYYIIYDFYQKLNIPYITKLEDNIYPIEYFYDNSFHLNSNGAKYRTKQIINTLKLLNIK